MIVFDTLALSCDPLVSRSPSFSLPPSPQAPGLDRFQQEMERVAKVSGGHCQRRRDLPGDWAAGIHPWKIDRGEESLDRMVPVQAQDIHPGSGTLNDLFT